MVKKIIFVLPLIFLALFLILILINGQQGCGPAECFNDNDCVKVQITCCPCNMGGQEKCVSRIMAQIYEKKLKDCPKKEELFCPALYNCKIENCTCKEGNCIAKLKPELE